MPQMKPTCPSWAYDEEIPLPKFTGGPNQRGSFSDTAELILREWERRQRLEAVKRSENAFAWFRRQAYRFLAHYVSSGHAAEFERVAMKDRRPHRLVEEAAKNPFKMGLLAMFSDESPMSRGERLVVGNQMLFAWAHDVPVDFFIPFISACGSAAQIAQKLRDKSAQPSFEHRFLPERLAS